MTKRKPQPASVPLEPAPAEITADQITQAIKDLDIDVPIYRWRVVGGRLEIHTYGGVVHYWQPPAPLGPPGPVGELAGEPNTEEPNA